MKRPIHKANLLAALKAAEHDKKHPEPMTLIHKRQKALDEDHPLPYRKPEVTLGQIDAAASAIGAWDNSDPFAYNRTALHVKQGYLDPKEVVHDYAQRVIARKAARAREVDAMKVVS